MKRSLAEKEMISQGDYIIVDKLTLFDIFPYCNNNVVHCAGPFPCGWPDIKLFKKCVVVPRLAEGEMIEADREDILMYIDGKSNNYFEE